MIAKENSVSALERRHPEWAPWLAVIREIFEAAQDSAWDTTVPYGNASRSGKIPLLAQVAVEPDARMTSRLLVKLMQTASRAGAPAMAGLRAMPASETVAVAAFLAALNHDHDRLNAFASEAGIDPEAFRAVAALLPVPFLHACNRRWALHVSEGWTEGYCPICGAWPSLAQVCGIERRRYLRCGKCGAAWRVHGLSCCYCSTTDHDELASLVPHQDESKSLIEVCNTCQGYLKSLTTLQASPPAQVILDDLASVELDLAAAARGYKRPQDSGYELNVRLAGNDV